MSSCYMLLRWLLEYLALRIRSKEFKELEIIVLRHELAILRRTLIRGQESSWKARKYFPRTCE
jgi:hypothetical protein